MIRAALREWLPFEARVAIRRAPAILRWALRRVAPRRAPVEGFPYLQCERASPLARPTAIYAREQQRAKEHNVAIAAALLDGVVIAPGAELSWHAVIGPPIAPRGFQSGPELHDGVLTEGPGGGLCQVANLLYWLALHAGLDVVERHRHHLDLFPDHERTAPFGCGATVYFPHRDLRVRNPLGQPVRLAFRVVDGALHGEVRVPMDSGARWSLVERDHRFVRRGEAVWRENALFRRCERDGQSVEELVSQNSARVLYDVPADLLAPEVPECA